MGRLSVRKIDALTKPGFYGDDRAPTLYLRVAPGGSKSWVQRLRVNGKRRDIGLGGYPVVSLQAARDRAIDNRRVARDGGDPLAGRKRRVPSFATVAAAELKQASAGAAAKTVSTWGRLYERYALPRLGHRPVDAIDKAEVIDVLLQVESDPMRTKLRTRLRAAFAYAEAHGWRRDNPAGEGIQAALPKQQVTDDHHAALAYEEVPAALAAISACDRISPVAVLALRLVVLTGCRSGEVREARWSEFDLDAARWTIPAERMKAKRPHVVPLTDAALDVLHEASRLRRAAGDLVFPAANGRGRKAMEDGQLRRVLRLVGLADRATVHGFRATFRTWAMAETDADHAVMELCLAHTVGDRTERAYARSDLYAKRALLMDRWARFATGTGTADVVKLRA